MDVGSPQHEFTKPEVGWKVYYREWLLLGSAYLSPVVALVFWQSGAALQRSGGVMVFFAVVTEFITLNKANWKHLFNSSRAYLGHRPWTFSTTDRVIGWIAFFAALVGTLLWVFGDLLLLSLEPSSTTPTSQAWLWGDFVRIDLGLIISIVALAISGRIAWLTIFKPPVLVTFMSKIIVWELFEDDQPGEPERVLLPTLTIRNLGAKPAVISELRLQFEASDGGHVDARPESLFTSSLIFENENKYQSEGRKAFPINFDEFFNGFSLLSGELWSDKFAFRVPDQGFPRLSGKTKVIVQAKILGGDDWSTLKSTTIDFDDHFNSRSSMEEPISMRIFYTREV